MTTPGRVIGNDLVIAAFRDKAQTVGPRIFEVTRKFGFLAQTKVRANMSGRSGAIFHPEGEEDAGPPGEIGPRAITGDLRRSVTVETAIDGTTVRAVAGSNEPQALRLELGFVGTDSLGRHYDQPPYPAWRPAYDDLTPKYRLEVEAVAVIK
jgi:hypothetical protein